MSNCYRSVVVVLVVYINIYMFCSQCVQATTFQWRSNMNKPNGIQMENDDTARHVFSIVTFTRILSWNKLAIGPLFLLVRFASQPCHNTQQILANLFDWPFIIEVFFRVEIDGLIWCQTNFQKWLNRFVPNYGSLNIYKCLLSS